MNTLILNLNFLSKLKIKIFPFYRSKEIKEIFKILEETRENDDKKNVAMFVGGCVRKYLQNQKIDDIDIATVFSPEELRKKFKNTNIKFIETGIEHGSITLLSGEKKFEITTLRKDIKTDGRHAKIEFTDNWQEDSNRRDFTINAIYLDKNGKIFDPQLGLSDLKNNIVKFIGDPIKRIEEDYLRIIRFIRFSLQYNSDLETSTMQAIKLKLNGIKNLSKERILNELFKILDLKNFNDLAYKKDIINIFKLIFPELKFLKRLENLNLIKDQFKIEKKLLLTILLIDDSNNYDYFCHKYKVSNDISKYLATYAKCYSELQTDKNFFKKNLKKNLYHFGKETIKNLYLISFLNKKKINLQDFKKNIKIILETKFPKFLFNGEYLKKRGLIEGKKIGDALKELEKNWIKNEFHLTEQEIFSIISKIK